MESSGSGVAQVDPADVPRGARGARGARARLPAAAAALGVGVSSRSSPLPRRGREGAFARAGRSAPHPHGGAPRRSALFRRASSKQALMYQEAEAEIERWLEELDEERQVVMGTAQEDRGAPPSDDRGASRGGCSAHAWKRPTVRPRASSPKPRLEAAKYSSSSVIQPDAGARPSISASSHVTTDSWLTRVQAAAPAKEEPSIQWSPGVTSASAAPTTSGAVAEDHESTPQVESPKVETPDFQVPDVEMPERAVPLAGSELGLDEPPPSLSTTDEPESEKRRAVWRAGTEHRHARPRPACVGRRRASVRRRIYPRRRRLGCERDRRRWHRAQRIPLETRTAQPEALRFGQVRAMTAAAVR